MSSWKVRKLVMLASLAGALGGAGFAIVLFSIFAGVTLAPMLKAALFAALLAGALLSLWVHKQIPGEQHRRLFS